MENKQEVEFLEWKNSLKGRFASHLEKLRDRLEADLARMRGKVKSVEALAAHNLVERKISVLAAILDGPRPEWEKPGPAPRPARRAEITRPPTAEEILEGAKYLVAAGKADKLTAAQREALGK